MGFGSPIHWVIFGVLAILVLGGGRFSNMMGDVAKGIKQFKKGMAEDDDAVKPAAPTRIEGKPAPEAGLQAEAERAREEQR